ncbi:fused DSP-PTPase phosphatase/NAD kinase-like protein [Planctomicrobium piriforme]|uniref:Tyrosine phosphatase family protein n=1 Tax=Planctomicrobium piriforme TaxID=1576369 RepID=A0A1I3BKM8_9PLAN|nr:tyrosine-protein phosphatase [Planctomicrobium piriforme]SFH62832.1 Tyrosine phosphatase family protein [Planctomicrobium piriforme]
MSTRFRTYLLLSLFTLAWTALGRGEEPAAQQRPQNWAQRVQIDGVPNLHKVSDSLYRSAQPSKEGMKNLKATGIKTVVNLRSFHSDRDEIEGLGLGYEHIYMKAWHPEEKEVIRFLQIVGDECRQPVILHCQYGADRTGTMCAIYRIAVQGWTKEQAINEMVNGGYGFSPAWQNLIHYIRDLDVELIQKAAANAPVVSPDGRDSALPVPNVVPKPDVRGN